MKGLMCSIYRDTYNCQLNKFYMAEHVIVPIENGVFEPHAEMPAVKLVTRELFRGTYTHAEPADREPGEYFAFGGSFIYSSDSRFPTKYPIPLHDRRMNLE